MSRSLIAFALLFFACSRDKGDAVKRVLPNGEAVDVTPAEKKKLDDNLEALKQPGARVVYPILKAYDWPAKEHAVFSHFIGKDKPPIPLIGYGYNLRDDYVFVTKSELGTRSVDSLHQEALANLEKVPMKWDKIDDNTLTASGHDFSAEKILSPSFIREAEKALHTDSILVSTPRRRVIYAFSAVAPKDKRDVFYAVVAHTLDDDSFGNALITNLVFEFKGDQVVNAFMVSHKK